jgi:hypothetical protein
MAAGGAAGASAAAAAAAAAHARRLLLGGLLIELDESQFVTLADKLRGLVITGEVGGWLTRQRIYLTPYQSITFYCKVEAGRKLPLTAIEVPHIDKGPLKL